MIFWEGICSTAKKRFTFLLAEQIISPYLYTQSIIQEWFSQWNINIAIKTIKIYIAQIPLTPELHIQTKKEIFFQNIQKIISKIKKG